MICHGERMLKNRIPVSAIVAVDHFDVWAALAL